MHSQAKQLIRGAIAEVQGRYQDELIKTGDTTCALQRRTLSLSEECKRLLAESGAAKTLLPLLLSKKDAIRWTTRQVTLALQNCSCLSSEDSQNVASVTAALGTYRSVLATRGWQSSTEHAEHHPRCLRRCC